MIPKWLYIFNHYLMLVSLGLFLLIVVISFATMPFWGMLSRDFIHWMCCFYGWAFPILIALFALSSGVVVSGFAKYRMKREDEE